MLMNRTESFFSIIIIRIDYNKRSCQHILRCQNSLSRSPRFRSSFRQSARNVIDILKSIIYSHIMLTANTGNSITNDFFKFILNILADDKYYMVETSLNRIMDRVVHDDVVSIIDRFQLFYSCSKSAANSGSHDK